MACGGLKPYSVKALDTPDSLDTPEAIAAIAAIAGGNRVRFIPSQPIDDQALRAIYGVQEIERKQRYITITGTGDG